MHIRPAQYLKVNNIPYRCINLMFFLCWIKPCSSLPPVVCRRVSVLFTLLCWFSFVLGLFFFFGGGGFLRLVYTMLPVSLDCPFLIASSVFPNVCKHNMMIRYIHVYDRKRQTSVIPVSH